MLSRAASASTRQSHRECRCGRRREYRWCDLRSARRAHLRASMPRAPGRGRRAYSIGSGAAARGAGESARPAHLACNGLEGVAMLAGRLAAHGGGRGRRPLRRTFLSLFLKTRAARQRTASRRRREVSSAPTHARIASRYGVHQGKRRRIIRTSSACKMALFIRLARARIERVTMQNAGRGRGGHLATAGRASSRGMIGCEAQHRAAAFSAQMVQSTQGSFYRWGNLIV